MTKSELIEEAFQMSFSAPRGDVQAFVETQCLLNPQLDEEEILEGVDQLSYLLMTGELKI